jgi:ABC-2 type transport system ATP-binding protein
MTAVIEIQRLRKSFRGHLGIGRKAAVDGLDLTVNQGEIFGLLGPNGAGKTTTLKMMLALLRPDAGRVLLFGRPLGVSSGEPLLLRLPDRG